MVPSLLACDSFLHEITTSGVKIRRVLKRPYLFHEVENAYSAKIIITCENSYSR